MDIRPLDVEAADAENMKEKLIREKIFDPGYFEKEPLSDNEFRKTISTFDEQIDFLGSVLDDIGNSVKCLCGDIFHTKKFGTKLFSSANEVLETIDINRVSIFNSYENLKENLIEARSSSKEYSRAKASAGIGGSEVEASSTIDILDGAIDSIEKRIDNVDKMNVTKSKGKEKKQKGEKKKKHRK